MLEFGLFGILFGKHLPCKNCQLVTARSQNVDGDGEVVSSG